MARLGELARVGHGKTLRNGNQRPKVNTRTLPNSKGATPGECQFVKRRFRTNSHVQRKIDISATAEKSVGGPIRAMGEEAVDHGILKHDEEAEGEARDA